MELDLEQPDHRYTLFTAFVRFVYVRVISNSKSRLDHIEFTYLISFLQRDLANTPNLQEPDSTHVVNLVHSLNHRAEVVQLFHIFDRRRLETSTVDYHDYRSKVFEKYANQAFL